MIYETKLKESFATHIVYGTPKRVEVKCYHTENGIASVPNEVMCWNCIEIQKIYDKQFESLSTG